MNVNVVQLRTILNTEDEQIETCVCIRWLVWDV